MKERFRSIRLFTVEKNTSPVALQDCKGEWLIPDTAVVSEFSATAWFYGVELSRKLQVPIGLIATSWGGTPAEAWTARKVVDTDPDLQYYRSDPNKNSWFPTEPGILYNAMINPLLPMIIRGAIWYQGESNVTDAISYDKLFPAMIHSWRKAWGLGNFPFYYVQIAPFTYDRAVVGAMLREAQMRSLSTSNTGMVVTMDITGDVSDIHPKNKVDVGKRLALWALSGTYGIDGIVPSGPLYSGFQKEGKSIRVAFEYAGDGLNMHVSGKQPNGFMIAGSDRHFVAAKVQVDGNSLIVRSDKVKDPVAVRYAYTNTSEATLFNSMELPASTFRTDNWPLVTDNVIMKARFSEQKAEMVYDLMCQNPKAEIHYTLDGSEPNCNSSLFSSDGISLAHSGSILARACVDGTASESIGSWDVKQHKGMAARVEYVKPYADQYSASGPYALVDGVEGSLAFNDGAWQGFEGEDLDIVLDLGQSTMVRKLTLHFLSDTNSWIFLPKHVEIKTSRNGIDYDAGTRFENMVLFAQPGNKNKKEIVTIKAVLMKNAKYIKIRASNIGVCPPGHPGSRV
ncbi:MAG: chitobiase/beta-hexosaminidase C-terminal domain-containing protein [Bacteroidales bacterium]|nr:chitobiase/beta-hexosaminidase C-terminal domain-containing protein [Bacteroidales bacterium]